MKLELKHLAPYLPYGVSVAIMGVLKEDNEDEPKIFELVGLNTSFVEYHEIGRSVTEQSVFSDCFPILHPLSDLTKEIEHNGKKFVPIVRLLGHENIKGHNFSFGYDRERYYSKFMIESTNEYVYSSIPSDTLSMDFYTISKLYEWHFDIHGLIQAGLAIDINTLEK